MNLQTHIKPELWSSISNTYEAGNYSHAILDAMHFVTDTLREKVDSDADGVKLVGQALGGEMPLLRVNKLQTETEKNIQRGLESILRGMYWAIRNPRSHEQNEDDQDTADAVIYFVNYLLDILDQSQKRFTTLDFLERIFDPDFVESDRYAELLVSEIPKSRQLDTLIEIYREKTKGDGNKLAYIFRNLLNSLADEHVDSFLDVVSDELKSTTNRVEIRYTIQIIPSDIWPQISEIARLRIENMLISAIKKGEATFDYEVGHIVCNGHGSFGTWSRRILQYFELKDRLARTLLNKLEASDCDEQLYVIEYFFDVLYKVTNKPYVTQQIIEAVCEIIKSHNRIFEHVKSKFKTKIWNYPDEWREKFAEHLEDVTEENGSPFFINIRDDDIPF